MNKREGLEQSEEETDGKEMRSVRRQRPDVMGSYALQSILFCFVLFWIASGCFFLSIIGHHWGILIRRLTELI